VLAELGRDEPRHVMLELTGHPPACCHLEQAVLLSSSEHNVDAGERQPLVERRQLADQISELGAACPLSGAKRTSQNDAPTSANDP
jgi:hypothetical protein